MANWTLTGELGSGKSVTATGKARDYLLSGRKLASNMDFYLENMLPPMSRATYIRIPDFPNADDLWSLGKACEERDENKFGALFLDELAVFLNSREWQGKARDNVIKYLRHIRKQHWHTFFLTQDIESIDAQARRALIEHKVSCRRTDRLTIPLIGWLIRMLGLGSGMLPRLHFGVVRYGKSDRDPVVEVWKYHGTKLHDAYNTDQIFSDNPRFDRDVPEYRYHFRPMMPPALVLAGVRTITFEQTGSYSVLSAWHLKGRYLNFFQRYKPQIRTVFVLVVLAYLVQFWIFNGDRIKKTVSTPTAKYEPLKSYMQNGTRYYVTTKDGYVLESSETKKEGGKLLIRVGDTWYQKL